MTGVGIEAAGILTFRSGSLTLRRVCVDIQTAHIETMGGRLGTCDSMKLVDAGVETVELVEESQR